LAAKLAVMVAGGDGLLTEGGGDTAVVLAHGASLSEMQLHLKEAVVVFNVMSDAYRPADHRRASCCRIMESSTC
jgi:hypothetical protein